MKRKIATALLLATVLSGVVCAEGNSAPQTFPELESAIEAVLKHYRVPGAAIAIVSRDKTDWIGTLGKADVAANLPVTTNTLFRIGSVSKGFAALAALQLQEQGKLKLTDTVHQWVPDVAFSNQWEATDPVRLIHLMEHTAGFDDLHLREYAMSDPTPITLKEALAYGADSRVSRWRPGSRMSYCNSGPAVLAAVVEKVSGERFENYVREHLFKPLRMDGADYFYTPQAKQRLTRQYHDNGITPYPYWHISYRAAGAVNASVMDMANYVRFYLQRGGLDGKQVVQPSSMERMETCETLPAAKLGSFTSYGLYNYANCEGTFVFHGHGGAVSGGLTDFGYLPEQGGGYVAMINSSAPWAIYEISKLLRHYVTRNLTPQPCPPVSAVPPELRHQYAGFYEEVSPRYQWLYGFERLGMIERLGFAADGRSASWLGIFNRDRYAPMSNRLLRKQDESAATFALLPDAKDGILVQTSRATFKKIPALEFWAQLAGSIVVFLLVTSSYAFALVWGARKLLGKLTNAGPLSFRVLPLLGALMLGAFDAIMMGTLKGYFWMWGSINFLTVSVMFLSIAFPVVAALSLYVLYRNRNTQGNRIAYWHSVLVALALGAVAIYYGYWGLIGLCLWA